MMKNRELPGSRFNCHANGLYMVRDDEICSWRSMSGWHSKTRLATTIMSCTMLKTKTSILDHDQT